MPTRSCPCRRATSSIRYVRPCGTGVFECRLNNACSSLGGAPGVEGAPDRRLADAVHHRRARRFHRRDGSQLFGQITFQWSRHDDRQIGLQQEVVDGRGQHLLHRRDDIVRLGAGEHLARRRGDRPAADNTQRMRLGQQVADGVRLQTHGPPGAPPGHRTRPGRGVDTRARRQVAQHVQQQSPVQRSRGREQRIRQRRIGFAVGAAAADQTRSTGQVQPRRRHQVPLGGGRGFDEPVGGHCRRPVRADAVVRVGFRQPRGDQPRGRRHLEDQAEPGLVDAGDLGQPLDVAHAQPTAAKLGNRCGAEGFEHQLDLTQQIDHGPGGHRIDVGDGRGRYRRIGLRQLHRSGQLAAHHLTDQPRQDHGFGVHLTQQAGGQQPLHRPVRRGAWRGIAGPAHRRALQQPLQQLELGRVQRLQPGGDIRLLAVLDGGLTRDTTAGLPRLRLPRARSRRPTPARAHASLRRRR